MTRLTNINELKCWKGSGFDELQWIHDLHDLNMNYWIICSHQSFKLLIFFGVEFGEIELELRDDGGLLDGVES